jgi:nucleoside-diphosphate-sugar epimerase
MKILLIGGTGLLSTDVMNLAVARGYEVYILNRGRNLSKIPPDVKVLRANIRDKNEVEAVLDGLSFDVVADFLSYLPRELENTLAVLVNKCKHFIFVSSACAYCRSNSDVVITERTPLGNSKWDYGKNKEKCEDLLRSTCEKFRIQYTIVRPYITYGNTRLPYGVMPPYGWHWTLVERIRNEKPIFLWDDGAVVCTITHVSDFSKGFVGLFCNESAYNEDFHIVSDDRISWKELLLLIGRMIGKSPVIVEIPSVFAAHKIPSIGGMLLGDRAISAKFDNGKIKKAVPDFTCGTSLENGIKRTLQYYRENNYLNGIDYAWDAKMDKLINDYYREELNVSPPLNLFFIDYLSTKSLENKFNYYVNRYMQESVIKFFGPCIRAMNYLVRFFK